MAERIPDPGSPTDAPALDGRRRVGTTTSAFGVGRRESHDAANFYARFQAPEIIESDELGHSPVAEPFLCADARQMHQLEDNSVALVVTSPPYFAGKEYELALGEGHVPASYGDYLELLAAVFEQCKSKLEPGGRIAVNVANLGRRPFRNLAADVTHILQDLKLLLRGEVIWRKARGASGSCAWGSYRSPANPVLRDTTERVIIASKWRFDRALSRRERERQGLPCKATLTADEFMDATLDVWDIPAASATRVGHPAPFPVELPQRLIELYTYEGDLVLDPFMGAGSALVAAARTGRRYVGYDLEPEYVELARRRVADEHLRRQRAGGGASASVGDGAPAPGSLEAGEQAYELALAVGKKALTVAEQVLEEAGFTIQGRAKKVRRRAVAIPLVATDRRGGLWYFDVSGGFTVTRPGLRRVETARKALGRAFALQRGPLPGSPRLVLLSANLPTPRSESDRILRSVGCDAFFDVAAIHSPADRARLAHYAAEGGEGGPLPGFWSERDLGRMIGE